MRRKPKHRARSQTLGIKLEHESYEMETSLSKRSWRKSQFVEISDSKDYENVVQYQVLESEQRHLADDWVSALVP